MQMLTCFLLDRFCFALRLIQAPNKASRVPTGTVETELKVTQCALDVHMECTPFVKD